MAKTKFEKMFPTKDQNILTGDKAAKHHRDFIHSQRSVDGKKTSKLTDGYKAAKRRKRPSAPNRADFFLSGKMFKSFSVNRRSTSSKAIVYSFISYLKLPALSKGLRIQDKLYMRIKVENFRYQRKLRRFL